MDTHDCPCVFSSSSLLDGLRGGVGMFAKDTTNRGFNFHPVSQSFTPKNTPLVKTQTDHFYQHLHCQLLSLQKPPEKTCWKVPVRNYRECHDVATTYLAAIISVSGLGPPNPCREHQNVDHRSAPCHSLGYTASYGKTPEDLCSKTMKNVSKHDPIHQRETL